MFEKEKKQYEEDCKTHERPWELWQWVHIDSNPDCEDWKQLKHAPSWWHKSKYRRKPTTFNPEYYSGLNWRDAEHLIGKNVECSNCPDMGWKFGVLKTIAPIGENFAIDISGHPNFYIYIRTCEETFKHPTISIGGVELPMPETVAPSHGTKYWTFPGCICHIWNGFTREMDFLKAGQVHLTEDNAKAWADWWKKGVLAKIDETTS